MDVVEVETMERDALVSVWAEICFGPVPHRMSAAFLRQAIIFEAQARVHGGFARSFRKGAVRRMRTRLSLLGKYRVYAAQS